MTCKEEGSQIDSTEKAIRKCASCGKETEHELRAWSCGDMEAVCLKCGSSEPIGDISVG